MKCVLNGNVLSPCCSAEVRTVSDIDREEPSATSCMQMTSNWNTRRVLWKMPLCLSGGSGMKMIQIRETVMWIFDLKSQRQSGTVWVRCSNLELSSLSSCPTLGFFPQLAKQRYHSDAVDKHCNRCLHLRPFGVFHTWFQLHLGVFSPSQITTRLMSKAIAMELTAKQQEFTNTWRWSHQNGIWAKLRAAQRHTMRIYKGPEWCINIHDTYKVNSMNLLL